MKETEVSNLVNIFGKDIYNFCRQLTQNKEEADELYQDTFLKVVEICDRIDAKNNPKSYILSIAVKLWKNRKRKFAWRERIAAMESYQDESIYEGNQFSSIESPEDRILEMERQALVNEAVMSLKKEYQVPMYLYYVSELPLKEIGRILHLPAGTVKSRLHKARKEVMKYLEVNGYAR